MPSKLRQPRSTYLCVARIVSWIGASSARSPTGCSALRRGDACERLLLPGDTLTRAEARAALELLRRPAMVECCCCHVTRVAMVPAAGDEAPFRAHLAAFAYARASPDARIHKRMPGDDATPKRHAPRTPLAPKPPNTPNAVSTPSKPPRTPAARVRTTPNAPHILESVPRDCIRALPRCALCASHFPASYTAPKRRTHLAQCAAARAVSDERLLRLVLDAVHAEIHTQRARWADAQAARTLFDTLVPSAASTPRWHRLEAQLPSASRVSLRPAAEGHRAARAALTTMLPRLVARGAAPPRYPPRPAPLYDAAYRTPARMLRGVLASLDPCVRAPAGPRRVPRRAYVATSDEEEGAEAYVATSDGEEACAYL